jgi:hypothetical protein
MRELATSFRPHVWVNVHSGMKALFTPYDHRAEVPQGATSAASSHILAQLNRRVFNGSCEVGSGGKTVGCAGGQGTRATLHLCLLSVVCPKRLNPETFMTLAPAVLEGIHQLNFGNSLSTCSNMLLVERERLLCACADDCVHRRPAVVMRGRVLYDPSLGSSSCSVDGPPRPPCSRYLAHGTATDWMWQEMRVPAAFTWEIYGDADAGYHDCFRMFNPVSYETFQVCTLLHTCVTHLLEPS